MVPQLNEWFMGIDLGTGSCKTVIVDQNAQVLGSGSRVYIGQTASTMIEQDPEILLEALVASVHSAIEDAGVSPESCQAFSIGGAFHSLVALDNRELPLTGVMTWVDNRPAAQAQAVRESGIGTELYQRTGCPVHGMYPLYKLAWMRDECPDIFHSTARFVSAKEYVIARLTGEYVIDLGIAAGSGLLNTHELGWDALALDRAGIQADRLSPLADPRQVLPGLKPEMAAQLGIPATTPIVLGSADAVNSSVGAGAPTPATATCMVGTSGAFRVISPEPLLDDAMRLWCYAIDSGHWLVGGAINNAGLALTWLRDALNTESFPGIPRKEYQFEDLMELAGKAPPGAHSLLCLPFFAGERNPYWNMNARGVYFGLGLEHDLRHMTRALLEGVAFRLRSIMEALLDCGVDVGQVRASGGFTRSNLWPQIIASVMDLQLRVPAWGDTSTLGAAFWAMLGVGAIHGLEDAADLVQIERVFDPNPGDVHLYDDLYTLFMDLYQALGEGFERRMDITSE